LPLPSEEAYADHTKNSKYAFQYIENDKGGFNITGYDSSVLGYDFSLTKTVSVSPSNPKAVV
jgi:hypothetical protein